MMDQPKRTGIFSGDDVEQAVSTGLKAMQLTRDRVEVEVLEEGSRGILGIGSKPARVRLSWLPQPKAGPPVIVEPEREESPAIEPEALAPEAEAEPELEPEPEPAEPSGISFEELDLDPPDESESASVGYEMLMGMLRRMGFGDVNIEISQADPAPDEDTAPMVLDIYGSGVDALIGRRGQTLAALQRILRLMVGKRLERRANLIVDVEGYRQRRERNLQNLARRMAKQAISSGRRAYLEPMSPYERRIVHLELREHPDVHTESVGEGNRRRVTIVPRKEDD
jgi:spoIIIJ-associated protein